MTTIFPTAYGYPVATVQTIWRLLGDLGVKKWNEIAPALPLGEYLALNLTDQERRDLRFAPKTEVLFLQNPRNSERFTGFRTVLKPWVTVFALVPYEPEPLVVVTAEYKHGFGEVVLVPPSGVMSRADNGDFAATAKREFEEETGFVLDSVLHIACGTAQGATVRQCSAGMHPFLGKLKLPVERQPQKLDRNEQLKVILVPLSEWMKLITLGATQDASSTIVTYLALTELGMLTIQNP